MLKRSCLAVLSLLAVSSSPGRADTTGYYFTYGDLEKIFVENQQYIVLDDEGVNGASLNHLHFTTIDVTDGVFTGSLWAPVIQPAVPQVTVPVTGKLTIHSNIGSFGIPAGQGYYYEIAFTWARGDACYGQDSSYKGAITFRGYVGAKMQGNVAGMIWSTESPCGGGDMPYSPQPFSGILTK